MLFSPTRKPNPKKFILRSDSVHLTDPNYYTRAPFNYDTYADIIQLKKYVALSH